MTVLIGKKLDYQPQQLIVFIQAEKSTFAIQGSYGVFSPAPRQNNTVEKMTV